MEYDPLTLILGIITIVGAVAGALKWYKRNTVSFVNRTFKNEETHNQLNMKLNELTKDYKNLLERQIKNEQDINDLTKELYKLKGKIE